MKKTWGIQVLTGLILLTLSMPVWSKDMYSTSFKIKHSTLSQGGKPIQSASFRLNSTVSQPSALKPGDIPAMSGSFNLYSGVWYSLTSEVSSSQCRADFDHDGDVDNLDLEAMASGFGDPDCSSISGCSQDLDDNPGSDGFDIYLFASDMNRTDCLDLE